MNTNTLDWSKLDWNNGYKKGEIAMSTVNKSGENSTLDYIQNNTVYYILNKSQNEYLYPVYKTNETTYYPVINKLRLLATAYIAFILENGNIKLIKHHRYNKDTHILSDEELKQYRWYILQAIDL